MQPAAIHGDQFAFSSSLAIFVHASDTYKLRKLLAQQTQHINALCWSPVDANLLATSNAEKVIRVYSLEAEAAVYSRFLYSADGVSSLRWATHDEGTLLAAAGSAVAAWPFKITAEWKPLHSFKATITCMQQSATETRLLAVGCADASLHLFDMLLQKVRELKGVKAVAQLSAGSGLAASKCVLNRPRTCHIPLTRLLVVWLFGRAAGGVHSKAGRRSSSAV